VFWLPSLFSPTLRPANGSRFDLDLADSSPLGGPDVSPPLRFLPDVLPVPVRFMVAFLFRDGASLFLVAVCRELEAACR